MATLLSANQWLLAFPLDLGSTSAVLGPLRSTIAEKGAGSSIAGAFSNETEGKSRRTSAALGSPLNHTYCVVPCRRQ